MWLCFGLQKSLQSFTFANKNSVTTIYVGTSAKQFLVFVTFDDFRHAFATISFIAETFIFLYVGMDAMDIEKWKISNAR